MPARKCLYSKEYEKSWVRKGVRNEDAWIEYRDKGLYSAGIS
jgi:hypothetical protein